VRKVALASVVCYALLMVTGGAVRLTGSGLGCPDWPSCYQHQLTANVSFHPLVEFTNRLVTVVVTIVSVLAFLVVLARSPRRRDLCWLAGGLVAGVAGQIVLGGLVVLFKLNPYLVACHFLLTIVILADAVVLYHRSGISADHDETRSTALVSRDLVWLARIEVVALGAVSAIGTIVAGSGPHAGSPSTPGQAIVRIPIAFRDIAEAHSDVAVFLIGLTLASLFAFHRANMPESVGRRLRWLFELLVVQGTLGYVQFFLHDNASIVELHILGVTLLWVAAVGFYLSLHEHPVRPLTASSAEPRGGGESVAGAGGSPTPAGGAVPPAEVGTLTPAGGGVPAGTFTPAGGGVPAGALTPAGGGVPAGALTPAGGESADVGRLTPAGGGGGGTVPADTLTPAGGDVPAVARAT
jgi:cytochrome c oxidase assembly protein subunit 15